MRKFLMIATACLALGGASTASAQSVEGRVGKLESEMRAVQRKVFPGGTGQMLQPEIAPEQAPAGPGPGTPASSAITDLSSRVTALEQQIATLTGQTEQNQYRLRQLQDAFDAYKRQTDAKLAPPVTTPPLAAAGGPDDDVLAAPPVRGTTRPPVTSATTKPAADPGRSGRVAAIEKPSTGDAPEDEYLYGYRLWSAKLYPEAATQLKKVVTDYPKHRRASYAQNLLGRSYLDDGKPSLASMAFYDNYKKMPDGERASESLLHLGQALTTLKKPADACKVYGELNDVYGAKLSAEMRADVARGRSAAKCS